jgi:hypothetical protein
MFTLKLELIIRKEGKFDFKLLQKINKYLSYSDNKKIVYLLPTKWEGFINGYINGILRTYSSYIGIACLIRNKDILVLDSKFRKLSVYSTIYKGRKYSKYVCKIIIIQKNENMYIKYALNNILGNGYPINRRIINR